MKSLLLFCATFLFFASFSEQTKNPIIGKWQMVSVFELKEDVSQKHNPENDRWIEFFADGTFKSGGKPFGENSGKWITSESNVLFIDSDAGEDDDSYWELEFIKEEMNWKGTKFEFNKRFSIKYSKIIEE